MGLKDWFSRKAAPSQSSIFLDGPFSSLPQNIKTYAKEGYSENPIVFACANIIATAAASVKLEVYTYDEKGNRKVDVKHPLLSLMARPNPMQTWEEFAIEMVAWHRVAGEVFLLRLPAKGAPKELHVLHPELIEVKPGAGNVPASYVFGRGENKKVYPVNALTGDSQVMHFKTFNPNDRWRGLSPLSAAARSVDIHSNGSKWNANLLGNSARPSGVVEVAGTIDETQANRLRNWFKSAWQGSDNAGGLPLLTGGAKFTPLSHNPKDMDFQNGMSDAAKNVGLVYGVPLPLLTMEASTFSNMDAAQERLWMETVIPLLTQLTKRLSSFLVPLFDSKATVQLAFNADSVPALEPRRERLYKRMASAVAGGLLTPNEARAEMGFAELDGGDDLLVPGSLKPLGSLTDAEPADELVKAMKRSGYSAGEVLDALASDFGVKKAA